MHSVVKAVGCNQLCVNYMINKAASCMKKNVEVFFSSSLLMVQSHKESRRESKWKRC